MLLEKPALKNAQRTDVHAGDEPLPGTLAFVLVMGASFAVLWFLMYVLLYERW